MWAKTWACGQKRGHVGKNVGRNFYGDPLRLVGRLFYKTLNDVAY